MKGNNWSALSNQTEKGIKACFLILGTSEKTGATASKFYISLKSYFFGRDWAGSASE